MARIITKLKLSSTPLMSNFMKLNDIGWLIRCRADYWWDSDCRRCSQRRFNHDEELSAFLRQVPPIGMAEHVAVREDIQSRGAAAFAKFSYQRVEAVIVIPDAVFALHRRRIADLAMKARLPTAFGHREYVIDGGTLSYGEDIKYFLRRSAILVDKIFKGAKPADLPIEQPTRLFLTVNLKTAKVIGLNLPESFLLRADEVIE